MQADLQFDFKDPCSKLYKTFSQEFFVEECQISQVLFQEALFKGQCINFSYDVFGANLIESPIIRLAGQSKL